MQAGHRSAGPAAAKTICSRLEAAFQTYFGLAPPAAIVTLTALTPGDFAVAQRKAAFLGRLEELEALADMLNAECAAKPNRLRPVGFGA